MNTKYNKTITKHRLQLYFFFFLKNIKQSITHKLYLINIYFFIRNYSFNNFISIAKLKVKRRHLKYKLKQMRVKRFLYKTKEIVNSIKNPNGKITSVHAYLFYFQYLKQKIIQGLKITIKQSKIHNRTIVALFFIRSKIAIIVFLRQIKKCYHSKDLPEKEKGFKRQIILKTLKVNSRREIETNEKYRFIRRFVYINMVKYALSHITQKGLNIIVKENKLDNFMKGLLLRKGLRMLKTNTTIILHLKRKKEIKHSLAKKHFIKRMRYHINNKHLVQKYILMTIKKIVVIENKKTYLMLFNIYQNAINHEENLKKLVLKKTVLQKIKLAISISSCLKVKTNMLYNKIRINKLKYLKELIEKVKTNQSKYKKEQIAYKHILDKAKIKLIIIFKTIVLKNKMKRNTILSCGHHYSYKLKEMLFKKLILNKTIQLHNKKKYNELLHMRNEIIAKKLVQELIVTYSKQINQKESYISNQLITKRSRGLKTAFLWFNKLKGLVVLRKKYANDSLYKNMNKNKSKEINFQSFYLKKQIQNVKESTTTISHSKLLDDLNQLKLLRYKKRIAPKRLSLNNNN